MEGTLTTLFHERTYPISKENRRDGSESYDVRILVGFGIAVLAILVAIYALALASGVDSNNLESLSGSPENR